PVSFLSFFPRPPQSCCVSCSLPAGFVSRFFVAGRRASTSPLAGKKLFNSSSTLLLFSPSFFLLLETFLSPPLLLLLHLASSFVSYRREIKAFFFWPFVSRCLLLPPLLSDSLSLCLAHLPVCQQRRVYPRCLPCLPCQRVLLATASCPAIEPRDSWEPCAWAPPHDEQPS
ncbi:hypothetical protein TRIATDRAFT_237819, partial [Trichoderma atroviride IMI 206040]